MRPPEPTHDQFHLFTLAEAGEDLNSAMCTWEASRIEAAHRRQCVESALLDAAMYAGMTKSDMARITGLSRRQVARMLRAASAAV